jgi:hypothetical protein
MLGTLVGNVSLLYIKLLSCNPSSFIRRDAEDFRKMADGLFLSTARAIAKDYPDITFDAELLDNTCLRVYLFSYGRLILDCH